MPSETKFSPESSEPKDAHKTESEESTREEQIEGMLRFFSPGPYREEADYDKVLELKDKIGLSDEEFFEAIKKRVMSQAWAAYDNLQEIVSIKKGLSLPESFFLDPFVQEQAEQIVTLRFLTHGNIEGAKTAKAELHLPDDRFRKALENAIKGASEHSELKENVGKLKDFLEDLT